MEDATGDLARGRDLRRRTYSVVVTSTVGQRNEWLSNAAALLTEAFPSER